MNIELYLTAFVTLFIVIDPVGLLPLFVAVTSGMDHKRRIRVAMQATLIGAGILALFGLLGEGILEFIGIGLPAFRISGGVLLFLIAVEMLFERRQTRREKRTEEEQPNQDPTVFPLATPLIAGPGAMAAIILLMGQTGGDLAAQFSVFAAMVSVIAITFLGFTMATPFERVLGPTGVNVITRLLGMLLAALAVQFVVDGLRDLGVLA